MAPRSTAPPGGPGRGRLLDVLREGRWITRERLLVWGAGLLLGSIIALARHAALQTANGEPLGNDFINYFAAAKAAAAGHAHLAYNYAWFSRFEQTFTGPAQLTAIYSYPPIAILLSLPLALLGFIPALIGWFVAGVAACVALLRRIVGWPAAILAAIGAPSAFFNLYYGQNGCFTASLFACGLMAIERRPVVAGICFGCLACKPHFGLVIPFALIAGRQWRSFAAAGITVLVLVLATLALFGTAAWAEFLAGTAIVRRILETEAGVWKFMPTVAAAALQLQMAPLAAYGLQLISGIGAIVVTVAVWRGPTMPEVRFAVVAVAAFLATFYAWDYDTVLLIFAAAWLWRAGRRTGFLPWERLAVVALLCLVPLSIAAVVLAGIPVAPLVLWLVLAVLVRRAGIAGPRAANRDPLSLPR